MEGGNAASKASGITQFAEGEQKCRTGEIPYYEADAAPWTAPALGRLIASPKIYGVFFYRKPPSPPIQKYNYLL